MTALSATHIAPPYAQAFDLLATLVAVVRTDGVVVFANAALEDVMGVSRRTIEGSPLASYFTEVQSFHNALQGAQTNAQGTDDDKPYPQANRVPRLIFALRL